MDQTDQAPTDRRNPRLLRRKCRHVLLLPGILHVRVGRPHRTRTAPDGPLGGNGNRPLFLYILRRLVEGLPGTLEAQIISPRVPLGNNHDDQPGRTAGRLLRQAGTGSNHRQTNPTIPQVENLRPNVLRNGPHHHPLYLDRSLRDDLPVLRGRTAGGIVRIGRTGDVRPVDCERGLHCTFDHSVRPAGDVFDRSGESSHAEPVRAASGQQADRAGVCEQLFVPVLHCVRFAGHENAQNPTYDAADRASVRPERARKPLPVPQEEGRPHGDTTLHKVPLRPAGARLRGTGPVGRTLAGRGRPTDRAEPQGEYPGGVQHVRRLPGAVHSVWLCGAVFVGGAHDGLLGDFEQCH
uniref:(northern house mosquito) hypothetical protein n=1 Tax=Culex pipiens TaxID=7175 RepID=A0A8D8CQQ6_CULPI